MSKEPYDNAATPAQGVRRVAILVYPDVEVLDFAGPFEVFSVAARIAVRDHHYQAEPFEVSIVAATRSHVVARHGMIVQPHYGFDDAPKIDVLIVPGGVLRQPLDHPETLEWIRRCAPAATITAGVCTGTFILAKAGVLDGLSVTTHWEDIPELRKAFPNLKVIESVPYVDEGNIVTSAGIAAGIGMSLHVVERLLGTEVARSSALHMEYAWKT